MANIRGRRLSTTVGKRANTVATVGEVRQVVKSFIGQNLEHKRANIILNATATNTGQVFALTQFVTEGDGISQRTGRVIRLEDVRLRYNRVLNNITNTTSVLRTIVFLDTQNQGTYPAITDVLTAASPSSGFEVLNAQQGRFKVLHDEYETLCASSNTHRKATTWKVPTKVTVHYGGATDTAGSNRKNTLCFLFITNNALSGPDIELGVQLRYTDA